MKKIPVLIVLILSISFFALAQKKQDLGTKSKRAIKLFNMAVTAYNEYNFDAALSYLQQAKKPDKKFIEPYLLEANIYDELHLLDKEIESYKEAVRIKPDCEPKVYFYLAETEYRTGHYKGSIEHLQQGLQLKDIMPHWKIYLQAQLRLSMFAQNAVEHPVPFKPTNLGPNVNSQYDEYWPSITADEQTLFITVLEPKDDRFPLSKRNRQEDFYYCKKDANGKWQPRKNLGKPINTKRNEGAPTVSADGQSYYFTACNRKDGEGKCDIYFSKRIGEHWTTPRNIGKPVNSGSWESQPSVSADGRTLYFVSGRSHGYGKKDIWVSHLQDDGTWTEPVNLGPTINTPGDESSPFIHPDGHTLYFSSNAQMGLGGFDIFMSRKLDDNSDTSWSKPVNLGYPINTYGDEIGLVVNPKGNYAFFASERDSGYGKKDIYGFELPEAFRPHYVTYVKGRVFDAKTNKPLQANIEVYDLSDNKKIMELTSNAGDGNYLVCLQSGKNYAFNVNRQKYLFYSDNFSLKELKDNSKPFHKDIPLEPIQIGNKVILRNIFFETASYKLKDESFAELSKLISFLTHNATVKIEIAGHTDNHGSQEMNKKLSLNRAKAVYDYLVQHHIDANRLTYKGYGFDKPIATNDTEAGRALNRRTEFTIIGL